MKKIAITQRLISHDTYDEIREALDINWGKFVMELGFLPSVLPYEVDFKFFFKKLDIKGVILTGGNDLNILNSNNLALKRDLYENNLIKYTINNGIPLLGVCRGMQIIANYFGASFKSVNSEVNNRHKIIPNSKSRFYRELSMIKDVNCFHNFQITEVIDDFIISAKKENGYIKAIEHKKYEIFAQMWHSEREKPFKKYEKIIIKNFFENEDNNISCGSR